MKVWQKYLDELSKEQGDVVAKVLNKVLKFSPEAEKSMVYGVPALKLYGKPLIACAAHKNHFGVYPCSDAVVTTIKPKLVNNETAAGTIRYSYNDFPSKEILEEIVKLRAREIISETTIKSKK